jgi:hypothetical protein
VDTSDTNINRIEGIACTKARVSCSARFERRMNIHDASSGADGIVENTPVTAVKWKNMSFALLRVHWKDKQVSVTFPAILTACPDFLDAE